MSRSTLIASSQNWMNKDSFSSVLPVITATSWWIQVQTRRGARSLSRATTGSRVKISLTEDSAAEHLPSPIALEARHDASPSQMIRQGNWPMNQKKKQRIMVRSL
jgi:hypothetical protein